MNELVIMKNQQAVTTSLVLAETFEKEHKSVIRAIEDKIQSAQNYADCKSAEDSAHYDLMFYKDEYVDQRGRKQKMYVMTRDGWSFIAMGFTGAKADSFKLKYIDQFNQMEAHIKQQLDTSALSPELQMFQGIFQATANLELETKRLDTKLDNIADIVALNTLDWRNDANKLINKVVNVRGGGRDVHREVRHEIYEEVERRAGANLELRVTNKRRRMADEGVSVSKRNKLTKVDAIADEKKLVEIYLAVVKDFAIKYGVWNEKN